MSCRLVRRHINVYLDGELDPATQLEFERHFSGCGECREAAALERELAGRVKNALAVGPASAALRERVSRALLTAPTPDVTSGIGIRFRAWYVLPGLAAAAVVLLGLAAFYDWSAGTSSPSVGSPATATAATVRPIMEDVARIHSSHLPADVTADVVEEAPRQVAEYMQGKVGFPVRPAEFDRRDVRLDGGRVSNVWTHEAVALYYNVQGHRVTVVVFPEPSNVFEHGAKRFRVGRSDVVYHQVNGYTMPVRQYDGLNYVFTGDLESDSMLRLAASARIRYVY